MTPLTGRVLKVFVSSTSRDLTDHRAVARNVILEMGWQPTMMEFFGAIPKDSVAACREMLDRCDVVLLLVAFRQGWVPTLEEDGNGVDSITALELAHARVRGKPILAMLASDSWPQNLIERDAKAREWVEGFRGGLNLPAEFFEHEQPGATESARLPAFRTKVRATLLAHRERLTQRDESPGQPDFFESACSTFLQGECIPFIGPSVNERDLSTDALVRALWPNAPPEQACFATAAEFAERMHVNRATFLSRFEKILTTQAQHALPSPVLDLATQLRARPPRLVVSVAHDLLFEQRLETAGRDYALVTHVIRSWKGEHDGKLLVLRPGQAAKICLADEVDLSGADFVVYKPLGSPLIHARLDPDLDIDTVVATETDHLTFLGRLENQHTRVPAVFHRPFQRRSIVFLGVGLDVWHYRLLLQVFNSVTRGGGPLRSLVVREVSSTMEALAWRNLGAEEVRLNPNEFAQRVLQRFEAPVSGAALPNLEAPVGR